MSVGSGRRYKPSFITARVSDAAAFEPLKEGFCKAMAEAAGFPESRVDCVWKEAGVITVTYTVYDAALKTLLDDTISNADKFTASINVALANSDDPAVQAQTVTGVTAPVVEAGNYNISR